ncbi:MAG: substrate-binding periplasmic protein [Pseudomonas sp.]
MKLPLPTWIPLLLLLVCTHSQAQPIEGVTEESSYAHLENGKVAGVASAVVEAMLQRAGLNDYSLTLYPWARAYNMALQKPNVLIYVIARTPTRETLFHWVGELVNIDYSFYRLRERTDIQVQTLQDAKNYSVGVVRDDMRHEYLQAQGFSKIVVSANRRDTFKQLLNQQIQLLPMSERDAKLLCQEANIDFASLQKVYTLDALSTGLYMAYSLTTADEIVRRSRAAFDSLNAEGEVRRLMAGQP